MKLRTEKTSTFSFWKPYILKGELFLTEHHAMKAYGASGSTALRILWPLQ